MKISVRLFNCFFQFPFQKRCLPIHCNSQYVQIGSKCQRTITKDISVGFLGSFAICNVAIFSYEMRVELANRIFHSNMQFEQVVVKYAQPFLTRSNVLCIPVVSAFRHRRAENIMVVSNYLTTFLSDIIRSGTNDSKHRIRFNDFNKIVRLFQDTFRFDRAIHYSLFSPVFF